MGRRLVPSGLLRGFAILLCCFWWVASEVDAQEVDVRSGGGRALLSGEVSGFAHVRKGQDLVTFSLTQPEVEISLSETGCIGAQIDGVVRIVPPDNIYGSVADYLGNFAVSFTLTKATTGGQVASGDLSLDNASLVYPISVTLPAHGTYTLTVRVAPKTTGGGQPAPVEKVKTLRASNPMISVEVVEPCHGEQNGLLRLQVQEPAGVGFTYQVGETLGTLGAPISIQGGEERIIKSDGEATQWYAVRVVEDKLNGCATETTGLFRGHSVLKYHVKTLPLAPVCPDGLGGFIVTAEPRDGVTLDRLRGLVTLEVAPGMPGADHPDWKEFEAGKGAWFTDLPVGAHRTWLRVERAPNSGTYCVLNAGARSVPERFKVSFDPSKVVVTPAGCRGESGGKVALQPGVVSGSVPASLQPTFRVVATLSSPNNAPVEKEFVGDPAGLDIEFEGLLGGTYSLEIKYFYENKVAFADRPNSLYTQGGVQFNECVLVEEEVEVSESDTFVLKVAPSAPACHGGTGELLVSAVGTVVPWVLGGSTWTHTGTWGTETVVSATQRRYDGVPTGVEHSVSVTHGSCTRTETFTIQEPAELAINDDVTIVPEGACTQVKGSISVSGRGGTPDYFWGITSGGSTVEPTDYVAEGSFQNLTAGEYNVWLKDASSCKVGPKSISVPKDDVLDITASLQPILCHTDQAVVDLQVVGAGAYPVSITIEEGGNPVSGAEVSIASSTPGTGSITFAFEEGKSYVVKGVDRRGCEVIVQNGTLTPHAPAVLEGSLVSVSPESSCASTDGAVRLLSSGGTEPRQWALVAVGVLPVDADYRHADAIDNVSAGQYEAWLRDANGCALAAPIPLSVASEARPTIAYTVSEGACAGDNATLAITSTGAGSYPLSVRIDGSGGVQFFAGAYQANQPSLEIPGLVQGETYTLHLEDARGCDMTPVANTIVPASKTPIEVLSITAYDDTHCPGTSDLPLGKIEVGVSGVTGEYTYTLFKEGTEVLSQQSTGNTFELTGLHAGSYSVSVREGECVSGPHTPAEVVIAGKKGVSIALEGITNANGVNADGEIQARVSYGDGTPGVPNCLYEITPMVGTHAVSAEGVVTFSALPAGTYSIVADLDGCKAQLSDLAVLSHQPLLLSAVVTQPTCETRAGVVQLAVSGGVEPYTIAWTLEDGSPLPESIVLEDNDKRATNVQGGKLKAVVVDSDSPQSTVFEVVEVEPFAPSAVGVIATSACTTDGKVEVELTAAGSIALANLECVLSGGAAEVKSDFDPVSNKAEFTNLAAGEYTVKVQDKVSACVTLGDPEGKPVQVGSYFAQQQFDVQPAACPPDAIEGNNVASYAFDFQPSEQIRVEYALEDAVGVEVYKEEHNPQDGPWRPTFANVPVGVYQLVVRNASKSCEIKPGSVTIAALPSYGLSIEVEYGSLCGSSTPNAKLKAQGSAASDLSYHWRVPGQDDAVRSKELVATAFGEYRVQIVEGDCKSAVVSQNISKIDPLSISVISKTFRSDGGVLKASVQVGLSGGVPYDDAESPYYRCYVVGNGSTDPFDATKLDRNLQPNGLVDGLLEGNTLLFVADKNNCYQRKVLIPGAFSLPVELADPELYHPVCIGEANGGIIVRLKEGFDREGMVFILERKEAGGDWLAAQTNGDGTFHELPSGVYRVRVKDKVGQVTTSGEMVLNDPVAMSFAWDYVGAKPTCASGVYKLIECTVSGGVAPYLSGVWEFNSTRYVRDFDGAKVQLERASSGKYSLTVVDANGCKYTQEHTFLGVEPYSLDLDKEPARCAAYEMGSITIKSVSGGIPQAPRSLKWISDPRGESPSFRRGEAVQLGKTYQLPAGRWQIEAVQGSCFDTITVDVEVLNPPLQLQFEDKVHTICYNARIDSVVVSNGGEAIDTEQYAVHWEVTHGVVSAAPVQVGMLPLPKEDGKWQYYRSDRTIVEPTWMRAKVHSPNGCIDTVGKPIVTYPTMHFAFDRLSSKASFLGMDEYGRPLLGVLSDIPTEVAFALSPGLSNVSYSFSPVELFGATDHRDRYLFTMPAGLVQNPEYEPYLSQVSSGKRSYVYLLAEATLTNMQTGCSEKVGILTRSVNDLSIPNVFTPNGDGKNDRWLQQGDATYDNVFTRLTDLLPNIEVEVYTRSGVQIWSAKGSKVAEGWDGRSSVDGAEMPIGTYYYVMRFNVPNSGKAWRPISGSVTIVR